MDLNLGMENRYGLRTALTTVDERLWSNGLVRIKPIETQCELVYAIFDCQLTKEQENLVNPAGFSIGRAYLQREDNIPCLLYDNHMTPIGFISLCKWLGKGDAYSWSYYIDKRCQGKGYGKSAAELAISILKEADNQKAIKLSAEEDNVKAHNLYLSLGFKQLQERDGDDIVFAL